MTTARDLFACMKADPPKLTNGERLDAHLARVSELSRDQSAVVLDEYLRFLALAATGPDMAVPSPLIDAVWHKHIEDTRAYGDYCMRVIGRFVNHTPNLESQRDHPGYPQTLANYTATFGSPPNPRVWPSAEILRRARKDTIWTIAAAIMAGLCWKLFESEFSQAFLYVSVVGFILACSFIAYLVYRGRNGPWQVGSNWGIEAGGGCGGD